jgi:hypothetical protein
MPPPYYDGIAPPDIVEPPRYQERVSRLQQLAGWFRSHATRARLSISACCVSTGVCCRRALTPATLITLGCLVGTMAIIFGIFFGAIYPTVLARKYYESSTCLSLQLTTLPYRCCDTFNCACSECSVSLSCGNLPSQPLNSSVCCGGSECCSRCCSTCWHTVCTGSGSSRSCSLIAYQCNCRCCQSVNQQSCSFACGMCLTSDLLYKVLATSITLHNTDLACGRDDVGCNFRLTQRYGTNQTWPCWYNSRSPTTVSFDGIPDYNKVALAFFGIFDVVFLALLGVIVYFAYQGYCE